MVNDIESIEYIKGMLKINRRVAHNLYHKHRPHLPELNFLEDEQLDEDADGPEEFSIENPSWCGSGSGWNYETFKEILTHTTCNARLRLHWTDGTTKVLRVEDGKCIEKKPKTEVP